MNYLKRISFLTNKFPSDQNKHPFHLSWLSTTDHIDIKNSVTFFVGENGSGKSTLLEAIAYQCGFQTAGGGRDHLYFVESSGSALGEYIRLSWFPKITDGFFFRAESFYHFATYIDELGSYHAYGGKSLHQQSHGESFLSLFQYRFRRKGIYLLDEPEAALSPSRQLAFMKIISDLVHECKAQFIIATHSPILLGFPDAHILQFDDAIREVEYEETDPYMITKQFIGNRQKILHELLHDD
jgi:predicted ATPase